MSKTLKDAVRGLKWHHFSNELRCEGGAAYKEALLEKFGDARVYGLCETCGGSKVCPACQGTKVEVRALTSLGTPGYVDNEKKCPKCNGTGACPDCGTVSAVTKELRERAGLELGRVFSARLSGLMSPEKFFEHHREALLMEVDAVLSTVFGKGETD